MSLQLKTLYYLGSPDKGRFPCRHSRYFSIISLNRMAGDGGV